MASLKKPPTKAATTTAKKRAANVTRTPHEQRKLQLPHPPHVKRAAEALGALPAGFDAEGFEIVGDVVRVYGKVRQDGGADRVLPVQIDQAYGKKQQIQAYSQEKAAYAPPPAPTTAMRASPLSTALQDQLAEIHELSAALDELEQAAAFVTFPGEAGASGSVGSASETQAPVTSEALNTLRLHREYLVRLSTRVRTLANRLQS